MAVMKASEFVAKLKDVAQNYKTLYVMGCFGAPLTGGNVSRYCNNHAYNKQAARTFQSTLPAWGETIPSGVSLAGREDFNPLSPHGERQQTHTTFRREKLAHLHNIVSFRQQRGSSC